MTNSNALTTELLPLLQQIPGIEPGVTTQRKAEPLYAKALSLLSHYDEAMGCSTVVMDKSGHTIRTPNFKKQMQFCEHCKKYSQNPSPGIVRTGIWEGSKYPCEKAHADAIAESQRCNETRVYACAAGFAFWTSPFYRNMRYAGSLTAGGVLFCKRQEALKKILALCNDRIAAEKFNLMLKDVAEKNPAEIQAMANLLGICAEEISKKAEDSKKEISPIAWHEKALKETKLPVKNHEKKIMHEEPGAINFMEEERILLAAFQRGDNETGRKILNELMDKSLAAHPQNFEAVRFRAIELLVLLSRSANQNPGAKTEANGRQAANGESLTEINDVHLKRIQDSKTIAELKENLQRAAGRMSGKIFSFQGIRHASALRKAQRFIWENYTRKISLEDISKASGLSAPYFSTIFNEEMGEKLSSYLNRLRVERASAMLKETGKSLKEIAELCGFEDQSWFSKVFKSLTGISPGKYREKA